MAKHGLWMPIYWADYLTDTTHLTTFQHGAYLLLIGAYWSRGGPIPNDQQFIAQVTRTTPDKVARYLKPVLAMFTCHDGLLRHKRLDSEILKSCDRIAAGHAGANARWMRQDMPITITTTKEERKKSAAPPRFDEFWLVCPRKIGKAAAEKAWALALKEADPELMILAMRGFAGKHAHTDEKYIPGPATWLTDKRWLDEDGGSLPLDPETAADIQDRADRIMRRGKYAERYQ